MRTIHVIVFKNLGLILQVNGILNIIPVVFAFVLGEEPQAIGILLASFVSLAGGFFFSNLRGQERADYASLSILAVVSFIVLGAIGSIPYLYLHDNLFPNASFLTKLVVSYFESISAMTTTGLTVFDPATLPQSIIFYRAVTQWLGGVGIVFFILLFLNVPGTYARVLEAFGGYTKLAPTARGTYLRIIRIYGMYTVLFAILLVTLGFMEPFSAVIVSLTGISTGGMLHTGNLAAELSPVGFWIVIILMIAGATSFPIHERVWNRKIRGVFSTEFKTFVAYLIAISMLIIIANSGNWGDTGNIIFHVISAASTTGFQFIALDTLSPLVRLLLTVTMFMGGCTFSTAGGMKVIRMIIAFRSIPWLIRNNVLPNSAITLVKIGKNSFFDKEIAFALTMVFAGAVSVLATSAVITIGGYSFLNSLFESVSAFATTGLSAGVTSLHLPNYAKVALIVEMIVGRLEVIPVLITGKALYTYLIRKEIIKTMLVQKQELLQRARIRPAKFSEV